jgi:SAM-dependent methyltransferase
VAVALRHSPVGVEALDDPTTDPLLVTRMVRDIARANRWLGGRAVMRFGLAQLIDPTDRGGTLQLCDVGTGAGDLPLDAVHWAAAHGITLHVVGLERIPSAARVARGSGLAVTVGCAGALPFRARSVDIVLISQLAHHLDRESVVRLFGDCSRLARRGVLVCDLRPSALARHGFPVAARVLGLHRVTIADGVTSVTRGFSAAELSLLARRAGAVDCRSAARPLGRVAAWWRTDR